MEIIFLPCLLVVFIFVGLYAKCCSCCLPRSTLGPENLQETALQQAYASLYSNFISQSWLCFLEHILPIRMSFQM